MRLFTFLFTSMLLITIIIPGPVHGPTASGTRGSSTANIIEKGSLLFGSPSAVCVYGDYAYVASGPNLLVCNISDPADPILTSHMKVGYSWPDDITYSQGYVYAAWTDAFMIIDVTDPISPETVFKKEYRSYGVEVKDNLLYVVHPFGLGIYNISNPKNITELCSPYNEEKVGQLEFGNTPMDIAISGNYAYFACSQAGIGVVDISDKYSPNLVTTFDVNGVTWELILDDVFLYTTTIYYGSILGGLRIVNISMPTSPKLEGYNNYSQGRKIDMAGHYVYTCSVSNDDLYVFNVSDPASPGFVWSYSQDTELRDLFTLEDKIYLCEDKGLTISDITDPYNIYPIGCYATGGSADHVEIVGNIAYVGGSAGLSIINISDPDNPTILGNYTTRRPVNALSVNGSHAYIIQGSKLMIFDVSNPHAPTFIAENNSIGVMMDLIVQYGYAYIARGYNGFGIYSISNPYNITKMSELDIGYVETLEIEENYAYLACGREGLKIVFIPDPRMPSFVLQWNSTNPEWPEDERGYVQIVKKQNNYIFIGTYNYLLHILEFPNASAISVVGEYNRSCSSMDVLGNYVMTSKIRNFYVINVSDPSNPREVGFYFGDSYARKLAHSDSLIIGGFGGGGLRIFEFTGNDMEIHISISSDRTEILDSEQANLTVTVTQSGIPFPNMDVNIGITGECTVEPMQGITDENGKFTCTVRPDLGINQSILIDAMVTLEGNNIGELQEISINVTPQTSDGGDGGDGDADNGDAKSSDDPLNLWLIVVAIIAIIIIVAIMKLKKPKDPKTSFENFENSNLDTVETNPEQ